MKRTFLGVLAAVILAVSVGAAAQGTYTDTWREVARLGSGYVFDLEWSPSGDVLAAASGPGVWLYSPQLEPIRLLNDVQWWVASVSWSPDGIQLVGLETGPTPNPLYYWDTRTWQQTRLLQVEGWGQVNWSPDGERLALSTGMIEAVSGQSQFAHDLRSVVWSPDGSRLGGELDDNIVIASASTGSHQLVLSGNPGCCLSDLVWSPDGRWLAASYGGDQGLIRVWDTTTGSEVVAITEAADITGIDWSPDGDRLAGLVAEEGAVHIWAAGTWETILVTEPSPAQQSGYGSDDSRIAWSPDGQWIAAIGLEIVIWDTASGEIIASQPDTEGYYVRATWSPDGSQLATFGEHVLIWDAQDWRVLATMQGESYSNVNIAWSEDGGNLLGITGSFHSNAASLVVWNPADGSLTSTLDWPGISEVQDFWSQHWSPDRRFIVFGERVWDAVSGVQIASLVGHDSAIWASAWSPDGTRLATGNAYDKGEKTIRIWDTTSWQAATVITVPDNGGVSLSFAPDSRRLLAGGGGRDQTFDIWDTTTGQLLTTIEDPSRGGVYSVAWSPDGSRLATGGSVVTIWDARRGQSLAVLKGHNWWIESLYWSPDGRRIISISIDGTIRVWELLESTLPTLEAGATICLTTANKNANLRGGPGTNFEQVGSITSGSTLEVVGQNAAGDWYQIMRADLSQAWIAAFLVEPLACPDGMAPPVVQ